MFCLVNPFELPTTEVADFRQRRSRPVMATVEQALSRLQRSAFRAKFHLSEQDRQYIADKGMETIQRHAADFIRSGEQPGGTVLPVRCENGVRYTVPTTIRPGCAGDTVTLRFRVGNVYKNKKIAVYRGDTCIYSRKRPVLAPGEMETVRLKAELLRGPGDAVTVTLEEG